MRTVDLLGSDSNPRCDSGSLLVRIVCTEGTVEGGNEFVNEEKIVQS